jgi:hypothetical protein
MDRPKVGRSRDCVGDVAKVDVAHEADRSVSLDMQVGLGELKAIGVPSTK